MLRRATWCFLVLASTLASPAYAQSSTDSAKAGEAAEGGAKALSPIDGVVGHYGLGYFTNTAPLGVRYWMDRDTALDLNADFALSSGNLEAQRYGLELGYVMALGHYHYSVVFARLGLAYRFLDSFGEDSVPARHDLSGTGFLGAELFLGAFGFPNISLMGGYGLTASYTYNAGSAFVIGATSAGLNVTGTGTLGFHIYL